ncbi:MAG: hypothetical protein IJ759_07140 [Bacteroidales bacterium]|nr:hypothetical protein [Bacteroidales bacterium]
MKTKKGLYILLLLVLLLLCVGSIKPFYTSKQLNGWREEAKKPLLYKKVLLDGVFQQEFEAYYNEKVKFRNDLIRLRNQIYYYCFNVILNDKIIAGKNNTVYEKGYIYNALFGMYSSIWADKKEESRKIFMIQDTLTKMGKEFLFICAPGKGTYCPENIPSYLLHVPKKIPPQTEYMQYFKKDGVNYIDFDKWFIELKQKGIAPLYSKYGIHYNKYGCYLVIDSLSKYFNKKYDFMPEVVLDSIVEDYSVWENENDCYESANLIFPPKKEKLSHPYFHYQKKEGKRLKCIFVGDSYIWPLVLLNFDKDYFQDSQYWYYFNEVSFADGRQKTTIDKIDILKEIADADVMILVFTNATTLDLDNGFTEKIYELYYGKQDNKN